MAAKWKNDRAQSKREMPATLEPLDYKPKAVEDIDTIQMTKVLYLQGLASNTDGSLCSLSYSLMQKPNRDGFKHCKTRPAILESLASSQV